MEVNVQRWGVGQRVEIGDIRSALLPLDSEVEDTYGFDDQDMWRDTDKLSRGNRCFLLILE